MNEENRIAQLRKQLEELKKLKENDAKENKEEKDVEMNEEEEIAPEETTISQGSYSKKLGAHPSSGNYGKSIVHNEERGFFNISVLAFILIIFQISFVLALYFLLK